MRQRVGDGALGDREAEELAGQSRQPLEATAGDAAVQGFALLPITLAPVLPLAGDHQQVLLRRHRELVRAEAC